MIMHYRNKWQLPFSIALVLLVFVISSTFLLLQHTLNGGQPFTSGSLSSFADTLDPSYPMKRRFNLTILAADDGFYNNWFTQTISRFFRRWETALYNASDIQGLPPACAVMLTHSLLFLAGKTNKRISVIALPMGGHAPPRDLVLPVRRRLK
jgi:hypothetical protein